MKWILLCLVSPLFIHAGSVKLFNNGPYDLQAVIRGNDGSFLGEILVQSQKEAFWDDTYGQYGNYGGTNPNRNQNYTTKTPYTVLWFCLDGSDYAVCNNVATGALVISQSCPGARQCKPQKKTPEQGAYPSGPP